MHRIIIKKRGIDHKNRNVLDNRKENLRTCTQQQNSFNSSMKSTNKSGYKGVSWDTKRKKWAVFIKLNYKSLFCGRYVNIIDEARAYDAAAIKYFKEFACGNFI